MYFKFTQPHARFVYFILCAALSICFHATAASADDSTECKNLTPAECVTIDQTTEVWNSFVRQLAADKPQEALKYVHSGSVAQISEVLLASNGKTSDVAKSIRDFAIVEIINGYVDAALVIEKNGIRYIYQISFCIDKDKSWKICSM